MISAASPGFSATARNEASTAKTETTGGVADLWEDNSVVPPKLFPQIFERKRTALAFY